MVVNSLLGNLVEMNSSWIHSILDIPSVLEFKQKSVNFRKFELFTVLWLNIYTYMFIALALELMYSTIQL